MTLAAAPTTEIMRFSIEDRRQPLPVRQCTSDRDGNSAGPYRMLLSLDDDGAGDWRVTIEPGRNGLRQDACAPAERCRLVLTNANARPHQVFLSPVVNADQDHYCVTVEPGGGRAPKIIEQARVKVRPGAAPLSVYPPESGLPNWISAKKVRSACLKKGENCDVDFEVNFPFGSDKRQKLFRTEDSSASLSRRERLDLALGATIWLGVERYMPMGQGHASYLRCSTEQPGFDCMSHCTGVLIAPRLVATNAHCIVLARTANASSPEDFPDRGVARGWLRPLDGGDFELHRAPDLQTLTPVFVGAPNTPRDFAILWIGPENVRDDSGYGFSTAATPAPGIPAILRAPTTVSDPLTVVGYPGDAALVFSFDPDCQAGAPAVDLAHRCDTTPGSSGSGVFDGALNGLVGFHHQGFVYKSQADNSCLEKKSDRCENRAVLISAIRESIGAMMRREGLLASNGCAIERDAERAPLSLMDFGDFALGGARAPTNATILAAYAALPEALRSGEACA